MEKGRILIVDDDPLIRKLLETALTRRGYGVAVVGDGDAALRVLKTRQFDLLITDIVMPKRDGLALLRDARARDPEMEAIVITGYGNLDSAIQALRLGAFDYLQKPLNDLEVFANTVERALERRRLRQVNRDLIVELRAAKQQLEQQRARELERIEQIGRALASNLQRGQIVELLQQALLTNDEYDCEAIALLAWNMGAEYFDLLIRSRHALTAPIIAELKAQLVHIAQAAGSPPIEQLRMDARLAGDKYRDAPELDTPLRSRDYEILEAQGKPMGVLAMFGVGAQALSADCCRVFHILARQAAVALDSIALFEQIRELARRDGMTRLYNRLYFMDLMENEVRRSRRYRRPISLLFADIDHFKQINDSFGHPVGDEVLIAVARALMQGVRETDLVGRYGGEEFVMLLPESAEREALALAERLRRAVESYQHHAAGQTFGVTISIGVASFFPEQIGAAPDLVRDADEALLKAKATGRNCVYSYFFGQVIDREAVPIQDAIPKPAP